ncbi:LysR substrate-binding domain-containing protein [Sneathiella marina]|uniref:LysR substrate-binding domain-containing protein n=1 Tax=Sneathiella marina TaxID=2950108 RepID=A0ABY4VY30_9PROT|nr:LysR substrate-binding domain-containing protein [Sneathiella marina]USG59534.1 LysR substrate-binding domain-containing protein [Sneathiella marina]
MTLRIQDLYTFFVVARAGAMQQAANELRVTPGAISQRIASIEDRYGKRLFSRSRKGVELTKAGQDLWSDIDASFSKIEKANNAHFGRNSEQQIRISATPTFAYSCLVPRLGEFTDKYPKLNITIETDKRLVDLRSEPIDLAIRHGLGDYVGYQSEWLSSPELIVVGSPSLLQRGRPINDAIDCLGYRLLRDTTAICSDWQLWCEARGIDERKALYGPSFEDDYLIVKAAVEGQGLALLSDVYVSEQLKTKQLVKACDAAWPTHFAYYAVALPVTFERPAVKIFVQWLKAIAAEDISSIR